MKEKQSRERANWMLASAVAGVLAAGTWMVEPASAMPKEGEAHCAPGAKGQSSCAGFGNENGCHGQNSCAGKGWIDISKEECLKNKHIWKDGEKKPTAESKKQQS